MDDLSAKFVAQKIGKARWRPLPPGSLQTADTFATGSWDNEVHPRARPVARPPLPLPPDLFVCLLF